LVYTIDIYQRGGDKVKTAKLFMNGRSQAVRLPKEFRFEGTEVFVKRMGNAVLLLPFHEPWETLFASLEQFSEDYMESREQPESQIREDLFP
jgi:antitoxin VapB